MKISLLCPSRGRPYRFGAMVESALETAEDPDNIDIELLLDADDPTKREYELTPLPLPYINFNVVSPTLSVPAGLNLLAKKAKGEILMTAPDDILFRTPNWDARVREAFARVPDRMLIAYSNDGRDRQKCEFWFASRRWVEVTGRMLPEQFEHFCADQWVEEVAQACGRLLWLRDVVTEHMHFKYKKAARDATYDAKRQVDSDGRSMSERDNLRYRALSFERQAEIVRVMAVLQERAGVPA